MLSISRLLSAGKRSGKLASTQGCWRHRSRTVPSTGLIEPLERRTLLSSSGTPAPALDSSGTPSPPVVSSSAGEIPGTVFNDANLNGRQDGREKPLSGVQLYIDLNGDGQLEAGEPTATTDAQGQYGIFVPQGGTYQVLPAPSTGLFETNAGNGHLLVQAGAEANVPSPDIGLAPGAAVTGLVVNDIKGKGHVHKKSPPLSGWRVFADLNGDGMWQSNEPSAVTDSAGQYTISGLSAGKVQLRVVPQSGWKQTTPKSNTSLLVRLALKKDAKAKPMGLKQLA